MTRQPAVRNTELLKHFLTVFAVLFSAEGVAAEIPRELRVGRAGHAFDHLGNIGEQAEAAEHERLDGIDGQRLQC